MIHARHREVASQFVYALENDLGGPCLSVAAQARRTLTAVMGFEPPSWQAVAEGVRPETRPPDEFEPGGVRPSWQHEAASRTEEHFREVLFDTISDRDRALIRSQAGPGAGVALRVAPTSRSHQHPTPFVSCRPPPTPPIAPPCFRPQLPVWPPLVFLAITVQLALGLVLWGAGGLHWRALLQGFAGRLEVGSPPTLSCGTLRCLPRTTDVWKLWLTVFLFSEGLSSQLTRLSCVHCIATVLHTSEPPSVMELFSRRRAGGRNDVTQSWWTSTQSSIGGAHGGSCRWSAETRSFLAHLAKAQSRQEVPLLQRRAEQAWCIRWEAILICASARAVATSLLELSGSTGANGECPSNHGGW